MNQIEENIITLFNVPINDLSVSDIIKFIVKKRDDNSKVRIYNANINALNIAYQCPRFHYALKSSDLVFCDGFGIRLGAYLIGCRIYHRSTPPDWIDEFAKVACLEGIRVFLVGDEVGVASKTAKNLHERHPDLQIAGTQHGFFEKRGNENDSIIKKINCSKADVVFVGMGMPIQEFWIEENIDKINAKAFLSVGAAFRWYAGIEKRAPKCVTDNGFEWLARLIIHPVKLFRRYLIGNPLFFARLFKMYMLNYPLPNKCNKFIIPNCSEKCEFIKSSNRF